MSTELFKACARIARLDAMTILRRRAEREGLLITICSWCKAFISEQDGCGVTGLSHGICPDCAIRIRAEMKLAKAGEIEL